MKVFIFGANGMLGGYLTKYLKSYFEVFPITRKDFDLYQDFSLILEKYSFESSDVIINAAGIIKQRDYSSIELIRVNSLFPHFLSTIGCNVIHITTDCVFSGKDGSYSEDSLHDCLDDYGKSKSLGECADLTVIRTSIIGEELYNKKSLIEWVKSNQNSTINGYLNHFWNGVTCLELAKQIRSIIETNSYWKGVRHYYSPDTVSKHQLVSDINEIYELNNDVTPAMSSYCDRSLTTKYKSPVLLSIRDQIVETKGFDLDSPDNPKVIDSFNFKIEEKLKNFPSINYVSLKEVENRRNNLDKIFKKYKLKKVFPHIYDRYKDGDINIVISEFWKQNAWWLIGNNYLGAVTSHFKTIKEWYETTDEPYAFFCEDDISFETVKYWKFTWEEFFNSLPAGWQCIQLAISRGDHVNQTMFQFFQPEVHLRSRCCDDNSCVAYLITRNHAKKLLDNYFYDDNLILEYGGVDKKDRSDVHIDYVQPSIENLIYTSFKYNSVFSFPLFVEDTSLNTIVWDGKDSIIEDREYYASSIIDWWKTKGKNMTIHELVFTHEKLKDFPSVNVVSIEESQNRREELYNNFQKYGINNVTPHIFKKYVDEDFKFDGKDYNILTGIGRAPVTSHLMSIKHWYENTDEEYAFFCEDDLSFETVEYWNFTWKEFFNKLPSDWECIQLALIREIDFFETFNSDKSDFHLRRRFWCDWSCCAYLIRRSHAKKLLDNYFDGNVFCLEYKGIDREFRPEWAYRPTVETLVYSMFDKIGPLVFPLFVENINFRSSLYPNDDFSPHQNCYDNVIRWWRTQGKDVHIEDLFPYDLLN
jgi:dTDP-4-dehydrorhamnose reductase